MRNPYIDVKILLVECSDCGVVFAPEWAWDCYCDECLQRRDDAMVEDLAKREGE